MDAPSTHKDEPPDGTQLTDAAHTVARVIERALPPGEEVAISTGAFYRVARVTWSASAWYGADDIVTYETGLSTTVLTRQTATAIEALHDPRFAGHGDSEARDTWLAGDAMHDVDTGQTIYLAG